MPPEAPAFDEVIHAPQRLRICAALSAAHKVEFGFLQERLGLSKSALSKHLSHLADAGYVSQDRAVRDARSRLWLSLTPEGRRAYASHVRALQEIVGSTDG
ncbi:helix-turn-helix domain-containing protein [Blastococcus saxobsidens]|uniref:Helix-turn-helix domain-containing protein n=1 Tax=Blastococcus saxobsidens TaxID=138336 RepID=A0A6L9W497_9ACTN|nr:transcriptional regulator [Blastococcus saxobsidens]NEK86254.1 helix-turn-helix domain-containing protein [Blastococcus saxobsidens]